jgi:hypothetical protein
LFCANSTRFNGWERRDVDCLGLGCFTVVSVPVPAVRLALTQYAPARWNFCEPPRTCSIKPSPTPPTLISLLFSQIRIPHQQQNHYYICDFIQTSPLTQISYSHKQEPFNSCIMSVVGCDLGTLNTVIAVARNRGVDVVSILFILQFQQHVWRNGLEMKVQI